MTHKTSCMQCVCCLCSLCIHTQTVRMCVRSNPGLAHVRDGLCCEVICGEIEVDEVGDARHESREAARAHVPDLCVFEVELRERCACRQNRCHKAVEKAVSEAIVCQIQASEVCALCQVCVQLGERRGRYGPGLDSGGVWEVEFTGRKVEGSEKS